MYLHGTSCHYKKSIDGNSIDVATRLRRICSSDDEFNKQADVYKAYLAGRGHKTNLINKAFKKLTNSTREATRSKKGNRVKNATSPVILTSQYNLLGPNTPSVAKHVNILSESSLKEVFPNVSIFVVFKRLPNLKERMVGTIYHKHNKL